MLRFKGLQKTTLLDYPGEVACTFFVGGCDFRCPYCYNPDLVFNRDTGVEISEAEALQFLRERKNFLNGVCLTGGEPLLYPEVVDFSKEAKNLGYKIKIDTNGYHPDLLKKLIQLKLVDYIAMDIKAPLDRYAEITGVEADLDKIKESVELIKDSGVDYEFRTTVFSGLRKEDFEEIGKWLSGSKKYCLQAVKTEVPWLDEEFKKRQEKSPISLSDIKGRIERFFDKVEMRE
jgi:pyruvate formate lyase activating enzyme